MSKFVIQGPQRLQGVIMVAGAKNAALKAIPAALLTEGVTTLKNIPQIQDVRVMLSIVQALGAKVEVTGTTVRIDPSGCTGGVISAELASQARTSIMLVGPLALQYGRIEIGHPGGCVIGRRPIDQFVDGFRALGFKVDDQGESYLFNAEEARATTYFFPFVSVTATEALMMTAAKIPGTTILKNAASEPEICALAEYLNSCGAKIFGAGTSTIKIEGVSKLISGTYTMIPDRIETGMFAILAATTRSPLKIIGCNPEHVESLLAIFDRMGVGYERGPDFLNMLPTDLPYQSPGKIVTHEYPGLATDLQPPLTVLLTQTQGLTLVYETIFEGRLFYTDLLNRMGANIILCDPHRALVQGLTELRGKKIESPDIRAGMAMVIAALVAKGGSIIDNIYQIERGHENIEARLKSLGAKISRIE